MRKKGLTPPAEYELGIVGVSMVYDKRWCSAHALLGDFLEPDRARTTCRYLPYYGAPQQSEFASSGCLYYLCLLCYVIVFVMLLIVLLKLSQIQRVLPKYECLIRLESSPPN